MFKYEHDFIDIVEVGPRDGLQNEKEILSIEDKFHYIELLSKTGLKTIEATSFVRKDKIPQMADAKKLFKKIKELSLTSNISFPCLVPNMKGYLNAKEVGVDHISLFSATSDTFSKKNINCSVKESFERMQEVATEAKADGIKIRGYISTAFGCPYEGEMNAKSLIETATRFLELGVEQISIGDTIGVGTPKQVYEYTKLLSKEVPVKMLAMHFHDTRSMALSNTLSALECDIRVFDSSSGGLGGCPYAHGATGNVATEDMLYLFHSLGLKTNVDLEKVVMASKFILNKVHKISPSKYFQTLS